MQRRTKSTIWSIAGTSLSLCIWLAWPAQTDAQTIFSAVGGTAAAIESTVDQFRNALGSLNPNDPTNFNGGRRQINWDAAPDSVSAPNVFPGDFFNADFSPRARGIEFSVDEGINSFGLMQLSATQASGVGVDFSNMRAVYETTFEPFSAERLFTPIFMAPDADPVTDVDFFSPADQTTRAVSRGLGVVFSDVDLANTSSIQVFDLQGNLLTEQFVEPFSDPSQADEHFSFLGILFDEPVIASAKVRSGNATLPSFEDGINPNNPNDFIDLVVLDDFIFGEPVPVPEPAAALLFSCLTSLVLLHRQTCRFPYRPRG